MEGDSFSTHSDEYRLLEVYDQQRRKSKVRQELFVRMYARSATTGDERFRDVADKLSQLVESGSIVADGLEHDGQSDSEDVVDRLVELLKKSGDELNEKIKRNHVLLRYLQDSFTYSMFEKLTTTFIKSVVPEHQQIVRNREQIAWTFEVTSRLKALDLHPMNRVMGFGAKYIKDHFTPWVQGHGGWEKAFDDDDDEEVH
ncbi:apoptosis facilitator Bcl-2-like protein 14 [Triplophysa rosa]|uniref:Apoptosis facilitator Bcl-2-like protein 14 n=1 Tax=Triplophysa rosa TaxID=992332 RepID=A0A9W7TNN7_TRIRA|nr:apoptosis facilitator Bcl-2-like protein 14 [Triplophysa rosa]KAI7802345.1 putative apoptosis facilitator Bcl-2-like protein 14 [Triplophysa rosa]